MNQAPQIISTPPLVEDELFEADLAPECEVRPWSVGVQEHGMRLDVALARLLPEFSRSYVQQLIESGAVTRAGQRASKVSARVAAGDAGQIDLRPTPQSQAFRPQAMVLERVYEDEHLLVINKPAGLVVHPAPGNWSGTLLNGLLAQDPRAAQLPRAGIVHRLDKDTSGLMVVARSRVAMDALIRLIAQREVARHYLAIAHHPWTGPEWLEIDRPIGRDPKNRLRMAVVDLARNAGKTAMTTVHRLTTGQQACLLECRLHTGRTHQIRVHLASVGHPLLGDQTYGGSSGQGLQRQALHAHQLAFAHPVTGAPLLFRSAMPSDMAAAIEQWGLGYNPPT